MQKRRCETLSSARFLITGATEKNGKESLRHLRPLERHCMLVK